MVTAGSVRRGWAVAWIGGLRGRIRFAAAVSLLLALGALAVALSAAAQARRAGRELSERLVPAATETVALSEAFLAEQTSLRDYVTSGRGPALQAYREAAGQVPGMVRRLSELVAGYGGFPDRLDTLQADRLGWQAGLADPQLAAMRAGDRARAQSMQDAGV